MARQLTIREIKNIARGSASRAPLLEAKAPYLDEVSCGVCLTFKRGAMISHTCGNLICAPCLVVYATREDAPEGDTCGICRDPLWTNRGEDNPTTLTWPPPPLQKVMDLIHFWCGQCQEGFPFEEALAHPTKCPRGPLNTQPEAPQHVPRRFEGTPLVTREVVSNPSGWAEPWPASQARLTITHLNGIQASAKMRGRSTTGARLIDHAERVAGGPVRLYQFWHREVRREDALSAIHRNPGAIFLSAFTDDVAGGLAERTANLLFQEVGQRPRLDRADRPSPPSPPLPSQRPPAPSQRPLSPFRRTAGAVTWDTSDGRETLPWGPVLQGSTLPGVPAGYYSDEDSDEFWD